MKNLFLAGLIAVSLGLSACAHKRCGSCCKDGACKMEAGKEGCKEGCTMKHDHKAAPEEKKAEDKK